MRGDKPLSERQAVVLQALYDHEGVSAAARALGVSADTIKTGMRRISAKYGGVTDQGQPYDSAMEDGYIN